MPRTRLKICVTASQGWAQKLPEVSRIHSTVAPVLPVHWKLTLHSVCLHPEPTGDTDVNSGRSLILAPKGLRLPRSPTLESRVTLVTSQLP